jgi:ABC-type protease/lipase transport system fused ATPase/permease subunit
VEHTASPTRQAWNEIKRILLFVSLFSFCINLLMLVGPIYMLQVYDRVLPSGSLPTLFYLTIAAGGLILVGATLEAIRSRVLVRLSGRSDELFSARLFGRLHQAALAGRAQAQPLRDLDTVRGFITGSGLFFFFDAPWTPLFLAFVFLLHPLLFAVALFGALILFGLALGSELVTRGPLNEAAGHGVVATAFAESTLRNADSVEAMGMLPGLRRRWLARHRSSLALQAKASDRAGLLTAAAKFVRLLLQVAILGVGAYLRRRDRQLAVFCSGAAVL